MLTCPNCQAKNGWSRSVCYRCGHQLPSVGTLHFPDQTPNPAGLVTFKVKGFDEVLRVVLETELILGRSSSSTEVDVDLNPYGASDKGVSRRHAKMSRKDDLIMITDLGSSNSTYINGQKVAIDEVRIVRDGDELILGRLVVTVSFW